MNVEYTLCRYASHARKVACVIATILWSVILANETFAGNCESYSSIALPARVDDKFVASSMYLSCATVEFDLSYADFKTAADTADELAFVMLIDALQSQEHDAVAALAFPDTASAVIDAFIGIAERMSGIIMVDKKIILGTDIMYILEVSEQNATSGKTIRSFLFVPDSHGSYMWKAAKQDALVSLIANALQNKLDAPDAYAGDDFMPRSIRWPLGVLTTGCPVYVEFDGEATGGFNALRNDQSAYDPLLEFYREAWVCITNGNLEAQARYYTPQSADKYRGWVSGMNDDQKMAYLEDILRAGKDVVFLLHADPVHYVFTRPRGANGEGIIKHEVIYDNPATGKKLLASFYFKGFLDKFLEDDDLFIEPVLLPVMNGEPLPGVE